MAILFRTTKKLENQIDSYLDAISQSLIVFEEGIRKYLNNNIKSFNERIEQIDKLEAKADKLRREVENDLYQHSLIPEHRGDVLGLLESMDDVADNAKETLNQFSIENPFIPTNLHEQLIELIKMSCITGEKVVKASRAFFKDVNSVKDHLHKVYFYEKEADKTADSLKRNIFKHQELDLAQKTHLRYFALHIDRIADSAENVADRLSIYTIKRTI